jgi:hypothetical protein
MALDGLRRDRDDDHPHLTSPIKGEEHEIRDSKPSPSMGEGWVGVMLWNRETNG